MNSSATRKHSTLNIQHSTLNLPNSLLDVGRWALDVRFQPVTSLQNITTFRRSLLRWYRRYGRDLPWRGTRDPYAILVSECMLQQTQVATVIPYYNEWLHRFPDFESLARASESAVLHAWQGLGYYARARNLHATAKLVVKQHGRSLPRQIEKMRELPGIGKYTAHAVATFAFDRSIPIVEANTARVLARLLNLQAPIDEASGRTRLWRQAALLVPKRGAARYNSALLDLGALICLPHRPKCGICPVRKSCLAKSPTTLPIKKARPRTKRTVEKYALVIRRGKILLEQSSPRWRGMWILPAVKDGGSRPARDGRRPVYAMAFPFTHHRVTLCVFRRKFHSIDKHRQRWFSIGELDSIPIPSPHRRAMEALTRNTRDGRNAIYPSNRRR